MSVATKEEAIMTEEERVKFLRDRGVEVVMPGEGISDSVATVTGEVFEYVFIPASESEPIQTLSASQGATAADVLPGLLKSSWKAHSNLSMDDDVVRRETRGRLDNLMVAGGGVDVRAPSAAAMEAAAAEGSTEVVPLSQPSATTNNLGVRLYIDEVGVLRNLPLNPRATALAARVGFADMRIHGDAYVGRVRTVPSGGLRNVSVCAAELQKGAWIDEALASNHNLFTKAQADGAKDGSEGGSGENYRWTQTEEDVEVCVKIPPEVAKDKKLIKVSYGSSGDALVVHAGPLPLVTLMPLFDKVRPDDCSWTVDKVASELIVTMEKVNERQWAAITLN